MDTDADDLRERLMRADETDSHEQSEILLEAIKLIGKLEDQVCDLKSRVNALDCLSD